MTGEKKNESEIVWGLNIFILKTEPRKSMFYNIFVILVKQCDREDCLNLAHG